MIATIDSTLFLKLFMFLVIMFIVYFDYMLSIVRLSTCPCISSYSACSKVHGVSGRHCVSMVLICCLIAGAPYIPRHVVDRGCDTPVESMLEYSRVKCYNGIIICALADSFSFIYLYILSSHIK